MKIRDSGMPDEAYWESLFDVPGIIEWLDLHGCRDVAELGCGFGTFTVPVARAIGGMLHTFDVDEAMLARTRERTTGLPVACERRDVMEAGFGVTADVVMLFNILHCEEPVRLLRHAAEALRPDGRVAIIHWRYGETPRGPQLAIRPRPQQIAGWALEAGLAAMGGAIELPPWHFGMHFRRST